MSSWRPEVSILVVHYGPVEVLRVLLTSIEAQTNVQIETIVVDNSEQGVCSDLEVDFPFAQIIARPDNPGFGVSTNQAADRASGEMLLVLNPDIELRSPEAVRASLDRFAVAPANSGIYTPVLVMEDGERDHACARNLPTLRNVARHYGLPIQVDEPYSIQQLPESGFAPVGAVNGAFMLMRADTFGLVEGFDERFWMYGEDLDLCARVHALGLQTIVDLDHEVFHAKRGTTGGRRPPRLAWFFYKSMFIYLRKHASGSERLALGPAALGVVVFWGFSAAKYVFDAGAIAVRRRFSSRSALCNAASNRGRLANQIGSERAIR